MDARTVVSDNELFSPGHWTSIQPQNSWYFVNVGEIWAYRELLTALAIRDIKVRYKQTVLGAGWAIIQPLTTMVIFTIIFGRLARIPSEGFPYPVFVYSALLPWIFFANTVSTSGNSLVGSMPLISKVYFPRLIVPLSSIGAGLVDFLVSTAILLLLMAFYGVDWTSNLLLAPFLMIGVIVCALAVGTILSALAVTYRDFRFVTPFLVQTWLYLTPVVYGIGLIPESYRWLFLLNPMSGYIGGYRSAFLGTPIDWAAIGVSGIFSLLLFAIATLYFQKVERRFADII
jgi:lipopolysaccharide transport system permease protein